MRGKYLFIRTVVIAMPLVSCMAQPDISAGLVPLESSSPPTRTARNSGSDISPRIGVPTLPSGQRLSISLPGAVRTALSWHPSIDQAVGTLNQRAEEIAVARAGYLPKVNGGINSSYDTDHEEVRPVLNVSASQMVYDFGKTSSAVQAKVSSTRAGQAQVLLAVDSIVRDTAQAFIEVQRNQALLEVARRQVDGIEAIAKLVRQRTGSGASTRSDAVQAEARVQAAQSRVIEITSQLNQWQTTLASLMGRTDPLVIDADVPAWLPKACEMAEPDWSRVPAMIRAQAEYDEASAQLKRSRAELFPTLSLKVEGEYYLDENGNGVGGSSDPDATIGLHLDGNLYDGGATFARNKAADFALKSADAARRKVRVDILQALNAARSRVAIMSQLLASLSARSNMMRETRDLYRRQYIDLGTRTLLDLLNAEQELHQVHFDLVNATHDLRRLSIDCLFNTGMSRNRFGLNDMTVRGVPLRP